MLAAHKASMPAGSRAKPNTAPLAAQLSPLSSLDGMPHLDEETMSGHCEEFTKPWVALKGDR